MVNIINQEIKIEETLKNKIEFICSFCTTTIFNGCKTFDKMYDIYEEIENYDNNPGKFDDFEL